MCSYDGGLPVDVMVAARLSLPCQICVRRSIRYRGYGAYVAPAMDHFQGPEAVATQRQAAVHHTAGCSNYAHLDLLLDYSTQLDVSLVQHGQSVMYSHCSVALVYWTMASYHI